MQTERTRTNPRGEQGRYLRQKPMTRQQMTRWKRAGSKKAIMLDGTEPMKAITMEKSGIATAC